MGVPIFKVCFTMIDHNDQNNVCTRYAAYGLLPLSFTVKEIGVGATAPKHFKEGKN